MLGDTLYSVDALGRVRTWAMEVDADLGRYRTVYGVEGGQLVRSDWTQAVPTNDGRSNARTAVEQAFAEVAAQYRQKEDRKYHRDRERVGGAKFFAPMLAQTYKHSGDFSSQFSQPKLDGIRCIAKADGLWTRQGKRHLAAPHVEELLKPLFEGDPLLVLDGELYNHDLKSDFERIASTVRKQNLSEADLKASRELIQYHVYDVPSLDLPFGERAERLPFFVLAADPIEEVVRAVQTVRCDTPEALDEAYADYLAAGYEGQMVRLNAPYEVGVRSKYLLKRKEFETEEFRLVRVDEGVGNWSGVAKTATIALPDGREQSSGMRGTQDEARRRLAEWRRYRTVTVRYQNKTADGFLRFPVIVDWHEGERED